MSTGAPGQRPVSPSNAAQPFGSFSASAASLAAQIVTRIRSYLSDADDIENVLLIHGKDLARFVFEQMKAHMWETPTDYVAHVSRGFQLLPPQAFNVPNAEAVRNVRAPVIPAGDTKKHDFGGFAKCCYPYQRFQSGPARELAALIDSPKKTSVIRWMKPSAKQFRIENLSEQDYEPDLVVETKSGKLIVEIMLKDEMSHPNVLAKARAAAKWVAHANTHGKEVGSVMWTHVLIPHDEITPSATRA